MRRVILSLAILALASTVACQMTTEPVPGWDEMVASTIDLKCVGSIAPKLRSVRLWLPAEGGSASDTAALRMPAVSPLRKAMCKMIASSYGSALSPAVIGTTRVGDSLLKINMTARAPGFFVTTIRANRSAADQLWILAASRGYAQRAVGHAGAGQFWPENTYLSLRIALRAGLAASEIDVRLTADTVPVLMHDETVNRTTNGSGSVEALRYAELAALDAGVKRGPEFSGEAVPRLDSVLALTRASSHRLIFDLKPVTVLPPAQYAALLVQLVERYGAIDRVMFSSGSVTLLREIRRQSPTAQLVYFSWGRTPWELPLAREVRLSAVMHHPDSLLLSDMTPLVDSLRQAGATMLATTTNMPEKADSLLALRQVSLILSDFPPRVYSIPFRP